MDTPLPHHGRYPFSSIDQRADYSWPDGKRLAFYLCNNIEYFAFGSGLGTEIGMVNPPPNHRSYAWRDYGNRVGLARILDMLDELGLPAAHNVNSFLYETHPQIFDRIRRRGDEIVGHGRTNAERQSQLWERDERALIAEATRAITQAEGRPPKGWLGPWLAESHATLDLLHEAGYTYTLDWASDDQPFFMKTRGGQILAVPYSLELNDSPAMTYKHLSARDFGDMIVDQFEQMIRECERRPLVFSLVLHTFIAGQAFRTRPIQTALEHCLAHARFSELVWVCRPGDIADYIYSIAPSI